MKTPLKVLVLTDRFPPESEGGAEISLHDTLLSMDLSQFELRVLTFGASDAQRDGIPVTSMPALTTWPRRSLGAQQEQNGASGMISAALMDLWERPSSVGLLGALALRKALNSPFPHPGSDADTMATSKLQQEKLKTAIRSFAPDVVHADNLKSILLLQSVSCGSFGRVAMARDHRFFCSHAHQSMLVGDKPCVKCEFGCVEGNRGGGLVRHAMKRNRAYRMQALATFDHVATTSSFLAGFLRRDTRLGPVTVVGNPHPDLGKIAAARKTAAPIGKQSVLFSGNLRREKGAAFFAEALSDLSDIDGLTITFAGRGPEEEELKAMLQKAGMAEKVSFPGFVDLDELYRIMAEASVVVAPTLWPEPFGRLPLEAGLLGRPVVASSGGGHLETIIDGETGVLFPVGDRGRFVAALRELLENPDRANTLGRAAKAHIAKTFAPDKVAERLGAVWRQAKEPCHKND